jgi:Protein of unknown function (DUF3341)
MGRLRERLRLPGPVAPQGGFWGLLAEFDSPAALYHACERVRDAGFTLWDAHAPFPVHGLDKAMGLRRSPLPWIVLASSLAFAAGGFALQAWVHSVAYPLVISGKPYFAWPTYVPVTFELGVLGGALGAVVGMLALNRLSQHHHPLFFSERFERASDDRFFISVQAGDPRFDEQGTWQLLEQAGAAAVERVTA